MASEASPLENELVAFVEGHPEIFSPQDVVNMRRKIIFSFGMVAAPKGVGTQYTEVIGLGGIATAILILISTNIKKKIINESHDIQDVLNQFEFCVEFINIFLTKLCATERSYHFGGGYNSSPTPKMYCETMRQCVIPHSTDHYTGHGVPNIYELVKTKINEYQSRVLRLWADVLIREGKITPAAIAEMQAAISGADGYERKMRQLFEECGGYSIKPNLDEYMLLKWLTLFHVSPPEQLTKTYVNLGSLDRIIFGIISQFVKLNNVYKFSYIPQSNNHDSELNMLHLTCNIIYKDSNPQNRSPSQPPVMAYLSSDVLDQCVQSVGRFPTTDEFIKFLNTRMIEKAAAFAPPPPSPPPPSAPPFEMDDQPFSELLSPSFFQSSNGKSDGGKKRKRTKRRSKSKKCKSSRRR